MYLFSEPCSFSRSRAGTDKCLSFGFDSTLRFSLTLVVKDLFRLTELMLNADIMLLAASLMWFLPNTSSSEIKQNKIFKIAIFLNCQIVIYNNIILAWLFMTYLQFRILFLFLSAPALVLMMCFGFS